MKINNVRKMAAVALAATAAASIENIGFAKYHTEHVSVIAGCSARSLRGRRHTNRDGPGIWTMALGGMSLFPLAAHLSREKQALALSGRSQAEIINDFTHTLAEDRCAGRGQDVFLALREEAEKHGNNYKCTFGKCKLPSQSRARVRDIASQLSYGGALAAEAGRDASVRFPKGFLKELHQSLADMPAEPACNFPSDPKSTPEVDDSLAGYGEPTNHANYSDVSVGSTDLYPQAVTTKSDPDALTGSLDPITDGVDAMLGNSCGVATLSRTRNGFPLRF